MFYTLVQLNIVLGDKGDGPPSPPGPGSSTNPANRNHLGQAKHTVHGKVSCKKYDTRVRIKMDREWVLHLPVFYLNFKVFYCPLDGKIHQDLTDFALSQILNCYAILNSRTRHTNDWRFVIEWKITVQEHIHFMSKKGQHWKRKRRKNKNNFIKVKAKYTGTIVTIKMQNGLEQMYRYYIYLGFNLGEKIIF